MRPQRSRRRLHQVTHNRTGKYEGFVLQCRRRRRTLVYYTKDDAFRVKMYLGWIHRHSDDGNCGLKWEKEEGNEEEEDENAGGEWERVRF